METTILDETTATVSGCQQPHGSLYQLVTCIRVMPRIGSGRVGQVALCSSSDVVAVVVECQLMLYGVADRQLLSTLGFESVVDCIACNGDGSLLVVGERSGAMHALDTKTGHQLFSQRLGINSNEMPFFKSVVFAQGPRTQLAMLTSDGHLHVVDGMSAGRLNHSVIDTADATLCLTVLCNGDIVTSDAADTLHLWSVDDGSFSLSCSCPMLSGPAVKCATLTGDNYILVLDSGGQLVLWSVRCFVAVSLLDCPAVADFTLVDRPPDTPECIGTIAALHNSETSSRISIYSLPCAELIYSVDVRQGALLFPSSASSNSVYLLEAWCDDAVSSWRVRCLSETDPQTQLRRLLAKQQFKEAERFAEKFELDLQLVYRECISHIVTNLAASVANAGELTSQLTHCLSQLDDVTYVVDCCTSTALVDLLSTNQLLSLARERLDMSKNLSVEHRTSLSSQLEHMTRRLAAFQVIRLSDEVLACLSVWTEVQIVCTWSGRRPMPLQSQNHIISYLVKIQNRFTFFCTGLSSLVKRPLNRCLHIRHAWPSHGSLLLLSSNSIRHVIEVEFTNIYDVKRPMLTCTVNYLMTG